MAKLGTVLVDLWLPDNRAFTLSFVVESSIVMRGRDTKLSPGVEPVWNSIAETFADYAEAIADGINEGLALSGEILNVDGNDGSITWCVQKDSISILQHYDIVV